MTIALLMLAAAVGGVLRWWLSSRLNPAPGRAVPVGTLTVNLLAAFAAGLANGLDGVPDLVARIGLLGALSTWSSLANEVRLLMAEGRRPAAACYLLGTVVAGIGLAWAGLRLGADLG